MTPTPRNKEGISMKKNFEIPEIEIMRISGEDVITTSYAYGSENLSRHNETPDW